VPTIAIIDGVAIILWSNDHPPPHIHAKGAGYNAKISIATGMVLEGHLPKTKLKRIRAWLDANRDEVAYAWDELRAGRSFEGKIG
jgi:Domain of unknown function (DUF4160)